MKLDPLKLELEALSLLVSGNNLLTEKFYRLENLGENKLKLSLEFYTTELDLCMTLFNQVDQLNKFEFILELNPEWLKLDSYDERKELPLMTTLIDKGLNLLESITVLYFMTRTNKSNKYKLLIPELVMNKLKSETQEGQILTRDECDAE